MPNIPINHKTIFLFDHSSYFSNSCGQTIDFDVANKLKSSSHQQQQAQNIQKLEPLNKTLWTCNLEGAFEFSRIVYDLFPENKLIRMVVTKTDFPLNSWNENEQGLDHIMNIMGAIQPPTMQTRQLFEGEEFINLCKALNIAVNSIGQISELQSSLSNENEFKNSPKSVPNSGRIILFTSSKLRNLEQIQEFLNKSIEECNKNIEQLNKNEKLPLTCLKINMIELVVIDVVPYDHGLLYEREIVRQTSKELRIRILSCKSGQPLPLKMIQLAQNFYELSVTSVTNIPMKEELNANSSASYDVDILHERTLHDQLKICGILKNCIVQKDGIDTVCLKWSNPKTNIAEFNFSSCAYRITPTDVNSRPASCLTSFLLSGRCVVLEVPRLTNSSNPRISSHVLCNHGNEIFMHCLNCCGKSNLDERPSIENIGAKLTDYRINEFIEFMKTNTFSNLCSDNNKESFCPQKILQKLEKSTRKWPVVYRENLLANLVQLKKFLKNITDDKLTENQFVECLNCLEYFQYSELKSENLIVSAEISRKKFNEQENSQLYFWNELENWLKLYQDVSDKHKTLYAHAKKLRMKLNKQLMANGQTSNNTKLAATQQQSNIKKEIEIKKEFENREIEMEKLSKRKKFTKEFNPQKDEKSLLEFWSNVLNEKNKNRMEFYGRTLNPNSDITPLYTNLKLDENPTSSKILRFVKVYLRPEKNL